MRCGLSSKFFDHMLTVVRHGIGTVYINSTLLHIHGENSILRLLGVSS